MTNSTRKAGEAVVVPVEPTPNMVSAWYRTKNGFHFPGDPVPADTSDYAAYRAMLAAAPASDLEQVIRERDEAVRLLREVLPPVLCGEGWQLSDDDGSHQWMSFGWVKKARAFLTTLETSNG